MIKSYFLLCLIVLFFLIVSPAQAANLLYSYGFEDWGGSVANTSGYPFGSVYTDYCNTHAQLSEVVTSYDGHSPHSGNYFWLVNNSGYALDPAVSGITAGGVNPYAQIGVASPKCGLPASSTVSLPNIESREIYASVWMKIDGWENVRTAGGFKIFNFYSPSIHDTIYMMHRYSGDQSLAIANIYDGSYHGNSGPLSFTDGNWHKLGLYRNYNEGSSRAAIWFDEDNPTLENASVSYVPDNTTLPNDLLLFVTENWSSQNPVGEVWVAVDDIEVWDGIPTSLPTPPPAPVTTPQGFQATTP